MTEKEIAKARETLPSWRNGTPVIYTDEQKQLDRELWCREMINSILVYHGKFNIMNDEYLKKYIKELGLERVKELVDEQVEDFEKAIVLKNTSVDCEGVSYNSIIWADER